MPSLHDIQSAFIHDAYTGEQSSIGYLNNNILNSSERLDIYYNNTVLGLTEILATTYPVLQKIIGQKFFKTIARYYIESFHQNTGNRHKYGEEFATFLKVYEPAASLPYLPDVAAIEWAYFQAEIADNATALNFDELIKLVSEDPDFIVLLHPAVHYIELDYNALEIWQEHQKNRIETIKLQKTLQTVLIWRDQMDDIFLQNISKPLKKLLMSCKKGVSFSQAMSHSSEGLDDLTAFQQEFAQVVSSGILVCVDHDQ